MLCAEDAVTAVEHGADAIWVSNAEGRGLDTAPSTISVLQRVAEAAKRVNPKVEVYVDGGVRRGTDIVKCLALGASIVFVGQPIAWGLYYGAKAGVVQLLTLLNEEVNTAMALTCSLDVSQLTEKHIIHHPFNSKERARL